MKKIMFVATATIAILYACSPKMNVAANKTINALSADNDGKPMLIGVCNKSSLEQAPFNEWFNKNYSAYKTNDTIIAGLKPYIGGKRFMLFMGTWCGDSRREIPRIFKMLDKCGVRQSQIKLVMLDDHDSTYKQSPVHEESGLNIHRVPTFIVLDNNKELGRIVESPVVSLEKDLLAILTGDNYKPNYKAVIYLDSLFNKTGTETIEKTIPAYCRCNKTNCEKCRRTEYLWLCTDVCKKNG